MNRLKWLVRTASPVALTVFSPSCISHNNFSISIWSKMLYIHFSNEIIQLPPLTSYQVSQYRKQFLEKCNGSILVLGWWRLSLHYSYCQSMLLLKFVLPNFKPSLYMPPTRQWPLKGSSASVFSKSLTTMIDISRTLKILLLHPLSWKSSQLS